MTNTREVETPLFASMISDNISLILIIGGVVVIAGIILILYFRKRRKEGKKDEAKAEQIESDNDEENE
jgi:LPXTG-motif cell wall-anchored protein